MIWDLLMIRSEIWVTRCGYRSRASYGSVGSMLFLNKHFGCSALWMTFFLFRPARCRPAAGGLSNAKKFARVRIEEILIILKKK